MQEDKLLDTNGITTRLEIHGIGRLQFLFESIAQFGVLIFSLMLITGGSIGSLGAFASDPSMIEDMFAAAGFGAFLFFGAWLWSFFIWYRRLSNMGYGALGFIIVVFISYVTAGLIGILLWLWMLFAGPSPKLVYVKG